MPRAVMVKSYLGRAGISGNLSQSSSDTESVTIDRLPAAASKGIWGRVSVCKALSLSAEARGGRMDDSWGCLNISPWPVSSHAGERSGYTLRIFSNLSVPMAPLFLRDLLNEALDIPMLFSKADMLMPLESINCLIRSKVLHTAQYFLENFH